MFFVFRTVFFNLSKQIQRDKFYRRSHIRSFSDNGKIKLYKVQKP